MKTILLDTNFLMAVKQFKLDVFAELDRICGFRYKLCVIDKTVEELKNLALKADRAGMAAKLALELIKTKHIYIKPIKSHLSTDQTILEIAKKENYIVATQDMALKRRLKQEKVRLIVLRQKRYLKLV